MTYSILTETDFFRAVADGEEEKVRDCYGDFIASVIRLCRTCDAASAYIAITFAEIELRAYKGFNPVVSLFCDKAMAFMKEMHDMLETRCSLGWNGRERRWTWWNWSMR